MALKIEQINQWRNCRSPSPMSYVNDPVERFIKMNGIISLDADMEATHIVVIRDPKTFPKRGRKICLNIDPEGQSIRQCDNCQRNMRHKKRTRALFTAHLVNFAILIVLFIAMVVALVLLFKQMTLRFRWPSLYIADATTKKSLRRLRIFEG